MLLLNHPLKEVVSGIVGGSDSLWRTRGKPASVGAGGVHGLLAAGQNVWVQQRRAPRQMETEPAEDLTKSREDERKTGGARAVLKQNGWGSKGGNVELLHSGRTLRTGLLAVLLGTKDATRAKVQSYCFKRDEYFLCRGGPDSEATKS